MAFTQRTTAPTESEAWFYADNPFYQSGDGMPNCTTYAWGRFAEILGKAPALSWGNAEEWFPHSDGYSRGQTPKVGAIICWRKGVAGVGSDGAGHVGVVEQVNADGSIVTSESGWQSSSFWWRTTRYNDGNWSQNSAYTFQGFIYNPAVSSGGSSGSGHGNAGYIWDYFMDKIDNPYGVAGLMGNLEAESGLNPDSVQGDIPYSSYSKEYTAKVDKGTISESDFVNNGPNGGGYGLAQWTSPFRKQGLYNMYKTGGFSSIGSIELGCAFLWYELENRFPGVLSVLKTAKSVKEASDKVLYDFESPSSAELREEERANMSQAWYDLFHGADPVRPKKKKLSLMLMYLATKRKV